MQINFETLYHSTSAPEDNATPMLAKDELAGELLEILRDAKLHGITAGELIESALMEIKRETTAAKVAAQQEAEDAMVSQFVDDVQAAHDAGLLDGQTEGDGITLTGADDPTPEPDGITLTGADEADADDDDLI